MIFQGFKYLDWETVNQAAQSICKTACQCEIHCISTQKRKTTKKQTPENKPKPNFKLDWKCMLWEVIYMDVKSLTSQIVHRLRKWHEAEYEQPNMKFII